MSRLEVVRADCINFLMDSPRERFDLIFIDAPYNTGVRQQRVRTDGTIDYGYQDSFDDFKRFLYPRLDEARKVLKPHGSFFLMLDWHEVHYAKVWMDEIFGRENFKNEIIWAYDYGARSKDRWPCKHDTILWYAKDKDNYTFNYEAIDRIPYMAPGRQNDKDKAELGKTPTDVWWNTIVPTNGSEKTGYSTQKPHQILDRIIRVHTNPGDWVLDFFAGSGTTGESCAKLGRNCVCVDKSDDACEVMRKRFAEIQQELF